MLHFLLDFEDLTIDGLIDTGALSGAISEANSEQIKQFAPKKLLKESPSSVF